MNRENVRRIIRMLEHQQKELELEILRTPTGSNREVLTEANIHLGQSIAVLQVAAS